MFVYEHKKWKTWKYWVSNWSEFTYCYTLMDGVKKFTSRFDDNISAYIWRDGKCSIHNEKSNKILASTFDKKHSKRMAKLLSYRITKERTVEDWIMETLA